MDGESGERVPLTSDFDREWDVIEEELPLSTRLRSEIREDPGFFLLVGLLICLL